VTSLAAVRPPLAAAHRPRATQQSSGATLFQANYDTADQTQPAVISESPGIPTSPNSTAGPNSTDHVPTTTHTFTHTELGISQVIDDYTTADFVHDPKGLLTTLKGLDGKRYNAVTDYQGSVLALIDTSGNQAATYTYSPYGATTATGPAAAANPLRWLGQFQLQNGAYLLGYRYYNPGYERFTAPDPTGQEANPYAYANGDPVNHTDPTGASAGEVLGIGLGLAAFALALVAAGPVFGLFALSAFTVENLTGIGLIIGGGSVTVAIGCHFSGNC
jgi:RHS repeat-associated protein